mgnify:CR=1 FL=1
MLSKDEIIERLDDVFRDVFDDDTLEVDENTTADDIEDWDSIEHITLIGAVEDEFKMRFKMGEVSGMKDVGEMIGTILRRILWKIILPSVRAYLWAERKNCGLAATFRGII